MPSLPSQGTIPTLPQRRSGDTPRCSSCHSCHNRTDAAHARPPDRDRRRRWPARVCAFRKVSCFQTRFCRRRGGTPFNACPTLRAHIFLDQDLKVRKRRRYRTNPTLLPIVSAARHRARTHTHQTPRILLDQVKSNGSDQSFPPTLHLSMPELISDRTDYLLQDASAPTIANPGVAVGELVKVAKRMASLVASGGAMKCRTLLLRWICFLSLASGGRSCSIVPATSGQGEG